jgi:hypothetical protein
MTVLSSWCMALSIRINDYDYLEFTVCQHLWQGQWIWGNQEEHSRLVSILSILKLV